MYRPEHDWNDRHHGGFDAPPPPPHRGFDAPPPPPHRGFDAPPPPHRDYDNPYNHPMSPEDY